MDLKFRLCRLFHGLYPFLFMWGSGGCVSGVHPPPSALYNCTVDASSNRRVPVTAGRRGQSLYRRQQEVCQVGTAGSGGGVGRPDRVDIRGWFGAHEAAAAITGQAMNEETAEAAGLAAVQSANPLAHNAYKVQLAKTAVKRAILRAAGQETGGF